jgi:hypothetical protein
MCIKINKVGKQEVGIWWVQKHFPWYGVRIWSLWPNIVCRFCWFLYTFSIHLYMHIFRCIYLSNYWWQKSDIWSQASYRYAILWEAFLDPSDSYFLIVAEKNATKNRLIQNVCPMCIKINKVGKQEVGIWWVQKHFPWYGVDLVGFYIHWTYMQIFLSFYTHWTYMQIFLSNYWWQRSDIWSQASYSYVKKCFQRHGGTYMKRVTKYQISVINSCWEKCD